ncbi:hypothetical protein BDP27DRAFT_1494680 [Rhodocollybia butyracea]|uniref:Uncharacterized protein n=1 Tax=Rhodocollybia butyracea TaxID=206335 RepID=A0A9P5TZD0_9AGAR|nr:hypothetical protein BDP27DRAFT_1494680 [Rhodocollybia butyracea]
MYLIRTAMFPLSRQIWLLDFPRNCRLTLVSGRLLDPIALRFIRYKLNEKLLFFQILLMIPTIPAISLNSYPNSGRSSICHKASSYQQTFTIFHASRLALEEVHPPQWRQLKKACGENPSYEEARKMKVKQMSKCCMTLLMYTSYFRPSSTIDYHWSPQSSTRAAQWVLLATYLWREGSH